VVATGVATTSTVGARRCKVMWHLGPAEPIFTAYGKYPPDRAADDLHLPLSIEPVRFTPRGSTKRGAEHIEDMTSRGASWRLKRVPWSYISSFCLSPGSAAGGT